MRLQHVRDDADDSERRPRLLVNVLPSGSVPGNEAAAADWLEERRPPHPRGRHSTRASVREPGGCPRLQSSREDVHRAGGNTRAIRHSHPLVRGAGIERHRTGGSDSDNIRAGRETFDRGDVEVLEGFALVERPRRDGGTPARVRSQAARSKTRTKAQYGDHRHRRRARSRRRPAVRSAGAGNARAASDGFPPGAAVADRREPISIPARWRRTLRPTLPFRARRARCEDRRRPERCRIRQAWHVGSADRRSAIRRAARAARRRDRGSGTPTMHGRTRAKAARRQGRRAHAALTLLARRPREQHVGQVSAADGEHEGGRGNQQNHDRARDRINDPAHAVEGNRQGGCAVGATGSGTISASISACACCAVLQATRHHGMESPPLSGKARAPSPRTAEGKRSRKRIVRQSQRCRAEPADRERTADDLRIAAEARCARR